MENKDFVTYEYTSKMVKASEQAQVCDLYEAFGWEISSVQNTGLDMTTISFKRDRKIRHKAELAKLERQAVETYEEIQNSKNPRQRAQTFSALRSVRRRCLFSAAE